MSEIKQIALEEDFSEEVIERGYDIFDVDGILIIQTLDCLKGTKFQKFDDDTQAGEQAEKDGIPLMIIDHADLEGWYLLNTEENISELKKKGYLQ